MNFFLPLRSIALEIELSEPLSWQYNDYQVGPGHFLNYSLWYCYPDLQPKSIYLITCESDAVKHVAEFCYDIFFWTGEFEEISNALACRDDKPEVTTRCGRKVNPPMRLIEIDK